jgi:hypothetical protein
MKAQFDHILQSSFYLWFDNKLTTVAEAHYTPEDGQLFDAFVEGANGSGLDLPESLDAFYCADRQLVANGTGDFGEGEPSGVYVNNSFVGQGDLTTGLLIDHNEGRILVNAGTIASDATISGHFKRKEVNVYITNETEEQLLIQNDFILSDSADEPTYLKEQSELGDRKYTLPAAFISLNSSSNEPFALGGLDDTRSVIRVVIITDSNYNLDAILSLYRDSQKCAFKLVEFEEFPFGEFFHTKEFPYYYPDFIGSHSSSRPPAFIDRVIVSKLFDRSGTQVPKGLRIGFMDFEISNVRMPRSDSY